MDKTLEKWLYARETIKRLEEKIDKYKTLIEEEMNKLGKDELTTGDITVTRKRATKTTVTKASLPKELWDRYSTRCNYFVYNLKKIDR